MSDDDDVAQAPASATKSASSGRPAALPGSGAAAAASKKPLYFEVAYVPATADAEFFRRVVAGHYVLTCAEPSRRLLEAIVDGRTAQLADQKLSEPAWPTVVVPTYESTTLAAWRQYSAGELHRLRVEVAPAASQCVVQLQGAAAGAGVDSSDNQCRAFRLEF